jgi:hypothetical protein
MVPKITTPLTMFDLMEDDVPARNWAEHKIWMKGQSRWAFLVSVLLFLGLIVSACLAKILLVLLAYLQHALSTFSVCFHFW